MSGRGSTCPGCGRLTFHDKGSYDQCSNCSYVGWSWKKGVSGVGKGKAIRARTALIKRCTKFWCLMAANLLGVVGAVTTAVSS